MYFIISTLFQIFYAKTKFFTQNQIAPTIYYLFTFFVYEKKTVKTAPCEQGNSHESCAQNCCVNMVLLTHIVAQDV